MKTGVFSFTTNFMKMKNLRLLLKLLSAITLIFLVSSCGSDVEEPPVPGPGPNEVNLMEIDKYLFEPPGSNSGPEIKSLVTIDSTQRTITTWFSDDLGKGGYQRRYFDEEWRLTKIFNDKASSDVPLRVKDSILIRRGAAGIFDIDYGNGIIWRYMVTSTLDGGKTIFASELNGNPQFYNRRIIDKNGLLIYSAVSRREGTPLREFHHFSYNTNHQLTSVKDTSYDAPGIRAFGHTIIKNNSASPHFVSFMKKMVGTDLNDWILYDAESPIPPFRFVYEFSNFVFLQNGAFTSNTFKISESQDGVNFKPYSGGDGIFEYEYEYDSEGRVISMKEMEKSKLVTQFKFRYYD